VGGAGVAVSVDGIGVGVGGMGVNVGGAGVGVGCGVGVAPPQATRRPARTTMKRNFFVLSIIYALSLIPPLP